MIIVLNDILLTLTLEKDNFHRFAYILIMLSIIMHEHVVDSASEVQGSEDFECFPFELESG